MNEQTLFDEREKIVASYTSPESLPDIPPICVFALIRLYSLHIHAERERENVTDKLVKGVFHRLSQVVALRYRMCTKYTRVCIFFRNALNA